MRWPVRTAAQRFWEKVDKRGPDECWEWQAHQNMGGYGEIKISGQMIMAHRFSYELHSGPIPKGLKVLHRCDNPPCVNPAHLWIGTQADNILDMDTKGRRRFATGKQSGTWTHPESRQFGELNHQSKLTSDQVLELRSRFAHGGISKKALAREYGISDTTVGDIIYRRIWNHI